MSRSFTHALTGRSITVSEGTRTERLVEADGNWSEDKPTPKKSTSTKEASDGSGNAGGRGGAARKSSNSGRSRKAAESAE